MKTSEKIVPDALIVDYEEYWRSDLLEDLKDRKIVIFANKVYVN